MTHTEFANFAATMCARMIGSCDPATRRQAAAEARALLDDLPKVLRNSPHCADEISELQEIIARTECRDSDWTVATNGEIEVRIDFAHREKAVEWRMVGGDDSDPRAQWMGTCFQTADFGLLDADEALRRVAAWLEGA